jgi:HEAT repeat protein
VRANAAAALADAPADPAAIAALVELLADPHPEPRFEAAYALACHEDRRATPVLCAFLSDRERALDAAAGLSRLRDPEAAPALTRTLARWFAPELTKVQAAHALARLGVPAGPSYLARARRSRRADVRGLAEELCGDLGLRDH